MIAIDFANPAFGHLLGYAYRTAHLFKSLAGAAGSLVFHLFVFSLVLDTFLLICLPILLFSLGFASDLVKFRQFEPSVNFFFKFLVLGCRD